MIIENVHMTGKCVVIEAGSYFVQGQVHTESAEAYTSHNTQRLYVEGTIKKIMIIE